MISKPHCIEPFRKYEPVFSKYCFYGCWCMPSGGADINRVWGQPVDEIDATCRDMQLRVKLINLYRENSFYSQNIYIDLKKLCYKCAKLDYGNQCKDTVGYRISLN